MTARRTHFRQSLARRLISLALLVSFIASAFPLLKLSNDKQKKDLTQPFPCQDRPCGCGSAAQCWQKCCCFSNAEKIAWAKKAGVTPPAFVVEAAEQDEQPQKNRLRADACEIEDQSPFKFLQNLQSLFSEKLLSGKLSLVRLCGYRQSSSNAGSCCSTEQGEGAQQQAEDRYVVMIEAMKCRGQGDLWNSLPWTILTTIQLPQLEQSPTDWERPRSVTLHKIEQAPPEPPPRLAV